MELEQHNHRHDEAGLVSFIVQSSTPRCLAPHHTIMSSLMHICCPLETCGTVGHAAGLLFACRQTKDKLVAYQGRLVVVQENADGEEAPNGSSFVITLQVALVSVSLTSNFDEWAAKVALLNLCILVIVQACPQLDATNLIVGRVVEGMDLVRDIVQLPTVKENRGSPYFQYALADPTYGVVSDDCSSMQCLMLVSSDILHALQLTVYVFCVPCRVAKALGDKRATVAEKGFGRPFSKVLISASGLRS